MMGPSGSADQLKSILGMMADPAAAAERLDAITAAEERLSKLQVEANNDIEAANVAKEEAARAVETAQRAEGKANTAKAEAEAAKRLASSEKQSAQQVLDEQRSEIATAREAIQVRENELLDWAESLDATKEAVEAESRHVKGLAAELKARGQALQDAVKAAQEMKL